MILNITDGEVWDLLDCAKNSAADVEKASGCAGKLTKLISDKQLTLDDLKKVANMATRPADKPAEAAPEKPAAPPAEPAKAAAEPAAKPAAEPAAKPADEPAKPAAEPAKPAAEPAKPAAEPAKAEATKPAEAPATEEKPAATEEKPAATEEKPAATEEKPAATEEKPAATEEKPAATEEKPAATEEKPAATEEKPAEAPAKTPEELAAENADEAAVMEARSFIDDGLKLAQDHVLPATKQDFANDFQDMIWAFKRFVGLAQLDQEDQQLAEELAAAASPSGAMAMEESAGCESDYFVDDAAVELNELAF
eukprot:tig00020564_g11441.t1